MIDLLETFENAVFFPVPMLDYRVFGQPLSARQSP